MNMRVYNDFSEHIRGSLFSGYAYATYSTYGALLRVTIEAVRVVV